jgi:hypothetical protein
MASFGQRPGTPVKGPFKALTMEYVVENNSGLIS